MEKDYNGATLTGIDTLACPTVNATTTNVTTITGCDHLEVGTKTYTGEQPVIGASSATVSETSATVCGGSSNTAAHENSVTLGANSIETTMSNEARSKYMLARELAIHNAYQPTIQRCVHVDVGTTGVKLLWRVTFNKTSSTTRSASFIILVGYAVGANNGTWRCQHARICVQWAPGSGTSATPTVYVNDNHGPSWGEITTYLSNNNLSIYGEHYTTETCRGPTWIEISGGTDLCTITLANA